MNSLKIKRQKIFSMLIITFNIGLGFFSIIASGGGGGGDGGGSTELPSYLTSPEETRDWLTQDEMMSPDYEQSSPIHNGYFMPVGDELPAAHQFEGTLRLDDLTMQGQFRDTKDHLCFPDVPLQFISHNGYLVPLDRDILRADNCLWNVILSPGKVWSEADDDGWSRASFPFVLTHDIDAQAHNGIAMFMFNDSEISCLRLQIVQETAGSNNQYRFNMWGQLPMTYTTEAFADHDEIVDSFDQELANLSEVMPWEDLEAQYTNHELDGFTGQVTPNELSATGIFTDSAVYMKTPQTRYGPFPYPMFMRHSVWSMTKSMGAGIAFFRLAQKYGDNVGDLLIKDYVNVTARHNGWDTVTFADCLDMATGIGESASIFAGDVFADEHIQKFYTFYLDESAAEKLISTFNFGNLIWGPGSVFSYNSIQTFVLSAAMEGFLREQEGPDINLWDWIVNEVYQPIGLAHVPAMHTIEPDGSKGLPLFFMGLYPTVDDVIKISRLLQNNGMYNGQQILSTAMLNIALAKTADQGMHAWWYDSPDGQCKYKLSFWSVAWRESDCLQQVPYMSGAGGNFVILFPNGLTAFRFADDNDYDPFPLINAVAKISPMCNQ